jgi:hypothetical protein
VIPIGAFLIGLLLLGILVGVFILVGIFRGGAGNDAASTELVDSVDLRFFCRVGGIVKGFVEKVD